MKEDGKDRDLLLASLNETVSLAAAFFGQARPNHYDGYQTAFEVLAHLVFWHRTYCTITQSLLLQQKPKLLSGSLADLNMQAAEEFEGTLMPELATCLSGYQSALNNNLRDLPDWGINFPFKAGCRQANVARRIRYINRHIKHHLFRQKRALERGKAWVEAYYS